MVQCSSRRRARFWLRAHQLALQLLQSLALGLREEQGDNNQLDHSGCSKEDKRRALAEPRSQNGKREQNRRVERGEARIAHALALGANRVGKDFADVNVNDQALGKSKEGDKGDQQGQQRGLVAVGIKDPSHAGKANGSTDGSDDEQALAAETVDQRHADQGEDEIGDADGDGLRVAGELAEAGGGKDGVHVADDGIDTAQLIEGADGDGQEQRIAILPLEDRLVDSGMLGLEGRLNVGELGPWIGNAHEGEHL